MNPTLILPVVNDAIVVGALVIVVAAWILVQRHGKHFGNILSLGGASAFFVGVFLHVVATSRSEVLSAVLGGKSRRLVSEALEACALVLTPVGVAVFAVGFWLIGNQLRSGASTREAL